MVTFSDVTNDPTARSRAPYAPDLAQALDFLGFRSLGLLQCTMNDPRYDEAVRAALHPEDAEEIILRTQQGEVDDVLSISGSTPAFGLIQWFFGELVTFETILDNGAVIETTMKPARAPRPNPGPYASGEKQFNPFTKAIFRFLMGQPPGWSHPNSPWQGYYVELVSTRDTLSLWHCHQERVARIRNHYHTTVRLHNSLAIYKAIRRRFQDTQESKGQTGVLILAISSILLLVYLVLSLMRIVRAAYNHSGVGEVLLSPCLIAVCVIVGMALFFRYAIPHLPVRLTPLDTLLTRIS